MKKLITLALLITGICSPTHSFSHIKDKATKGCGSILTDFGHKHVPCGSPNFDMELIINSKTHGVFKILIDEEDLDRVNKFKWSIRKTREGKFYAHRTPFINGKSGKIDLHRFIMNFPPGMLVDHADGNTINNMKSNLRLATHHQNQCNQMLSRANTSGYKGVHHVKKSGKYCVQIKLHRKHICGGTFSSAIDAAKKYNELALLHHGEFARLNIIPE